jgi:cytochrome P450
MSRSRNEVPVHRADIYTTDAITDPHPRYTALRSLGPVVWLSRHRVYALARYAECKAVLRDDKTFISGKGVALNVLSNRLSRGTTLSSDGAEHEQRHLECAAPVRFASGSMAAAEGESRADLQRGQRDRAIRIAAAGVLTSDVHRRRKRRAPNPRRRASALNSQP